MRYSRYGEEVRQGMQTEKKSGKGAIVVIVLVCLAAVIYFTGAAKVGAFISEKIVTPIAALFSKSDNGTEDEINGRTSESTASAEANTTKNTSPLSMTVEPYSSYLLQIGIFEEKSNAEKLAGEMQEMGCAGSIMEEDGKYRVFISGYDSKTDAENVKARIAAEYEMETKLYEIITGGKTLENDIISVSSELAENACASVCDAPQKLLQLSYAYDKDERSAEEVRKAVSSIKKKTDEYCTALSGCDEKREKTGKVLSEYYNELSEISNKIISGDDAALSWKLKDGYIAASICIKKYFS